MKEQKILSERIVYYCRLKNMSYYELAYNSAVPLNTLLHIIHCTTRNPGVFTVAKICNGLGITISELFSSEEFKNIEFDVE